MNDGRDQRIEITTLELGLNFRNGSQIRERAKRWAKLALRVKILEEDDLLLVKEDSRRLIWWTVNGLEMWTINNQRFYVYVSQTFFYSAFILWLPQDSGLRITAITFLSADAHLFLFLPIEYKFNFWWFPVQDEGSSSCVVIETV